MSELTTKTVAQVAQQVKRQFGDEDGIQIADADILGWINDAQRQIVSVNPVLQTTKVFDLTQGDSSYTYPAERIQYIQTLFYKDPDGVVKPLQQFSYAEAIEYVQKNGQNSSSPVTGPPQIWWSWAQQINVFPTPALSVTGGLIMDFIAIPVEVVDQMSVLSLPDRYFDAIVHYVLTKARTLDETYDAANFHKTNFEQVLGQLSEQENRIQVQHYPAPTVRVEDLW